MANTTTRNLLLTTIFAALALTGCNRVSPTEPQDRISPVPSFETAESAAAPETGTAGSSRTRPTRGTERPTVVPTVPAPSTEPTAPTFPTLPTVPPPAPPAPPMTSDCKGPCDGILRIPASDAYMAAIYAARDRVRTAVASGEIKANNKVRDWNVVPNVEWKACFFWVENGFWYDAQGVKHVGGCAAGMTDYAHKKIVISTKEEARTLALVKWEATNYYLYLIGRKDLLDRWQ